MDERRSNQRRRVLQGIKIAFAGDFCCSEGVIRNESDSGAQIRLNDGVVVPNNFKIVNEMLGYEVDCAISWRKGQTVGVQFTGPKIPIKGKSRQITEYTT